MQKNDSEDRAIFGVAYSLVARHMLPHWKKFVLKAPTSQRRLASGMIWIPLRGIFHWMFRLSLDRILIKPLLFHLWRNIFCLFLKNVFSFFRSTTLSWYSIRKQAAISSRARVQRTNILWVCQTTFLVLVRVFCHSVTEQLLGCIHALLLKLCHLQNWKQNGDYKTQLAALLA